MRLQIPPVAFFILALVSTFQVVGGDNVLRGMAEGHSKRWLETDKEEKPVQSYEPEADEHDKYKLVQSYEPEPYKHDKDKGDDDDDGKDHHGDYYSYEAEPYKSKDKGDDDDDDGKDHYGDYYSYEAEPYKSKHKGDDDDDDGKDHYGDYYSYEAEPYKSKDKGDDDDDDGKGKGDDDDDDGKGKGDDDDDDGKDYHGGYKYAFIVSYAYKNEYWCVTATHGVYYDVKLGFKPCDFDHADKTQLWRIDDYGRIRSKVDPYRCIAHSYDLEKGSAIRFADCDDKHGTKFIHNGRVGFLKVLADKDYCVTNNGSHSGYDDDDYMILAPCAKQGSFKFAYKLYGGYESDSDEYPSYYSPDSPEYYPDDKDHYYESGEEGYYKGDDDDDHGKGDDDDDDGKGKGDDDDDDGKDHYGDYYSYEAEPYKRKHKGDDDDDDGKDHYGDYYSYEAEPYKSKDKGDDDDDDGKGKGDDDDDDGKGKGDDDDDDDDGKDHYGDYYSYEAEPYKSKGKGDDDDDDDGKDHYGDDDDDDGKDHYGDDDDDDGKDHGYYDEPYDSYDGHYSDKDSHHYKYIVLRSAFPGKFDPYGKEGCLGVIDNKAKNDQGLRLVSCKHDVPGWRYDDYGLLHSELDDYKCLQADRKDAKVGAMMRLFDCDPHNKLQRFEFKHGQVKVEHKNLCVAFRGDIGNIGEDPIVLKSCSDKTTFWEEYYDDYY